MTGLPNGIPLFRREAVAHRAETLFGGVLLPRSVALNVVSGLALALVAALLLLVTFAKVPSRVPVTGWLAYDPGDARINSPRAGVVHEILAQRGVTVARGEPLVKISTSRSSTASQDIEQQILASLKAEEATLTRRIESERSLADSRRAELRAEIAVLGVNREKLELSRQIAQQRLSLAEADHTRTVGLHERGLVAKAALDKTADAVLTARLTLEEMNRDILSAESRLSSLSAEQKRAPMELAQRLSEHENGISRIRQRILEVQGLQETLVYSPIDGAVEQVVVNVGQTVSDGSPLVVVVPKDARIYAQLLVPTRASGFIELGAPVRLRYDAFPYQRFGQHAGTIVHVSRTILLPNETHASLKPVEPSYVATVKLERQVISAYGTEFPLRAGMIVQADVLRERRRVIEWLFDPIYAALGRS